MSVMNPSQYECDKMEKGDIVYIAPRSFLYKVFRKYFQKNKNKIKVRIGWDEPIKYNEYYQEDCTLMYAWELACMRKFENQVPVMYCKNPKSPGYKTEILKSVNVGLYNTQIVLKNNKTLMMPTTIFEQGIKSNERTLKEIKDQRVIMETLKYSTIKGDTFKKIIDNRNLENWNSSYCILCGKPVIFNFKEDKVVIDNKCTCGITSVNKSELTYDEMALWYKTQVNDDIKKEYKKFWFSKEM